MPQARLSHADAMTLWRARDVYRVTETLRALVVIVFVLEFTMEAAHGYWYVGVVLVAVQYAALRLLGWGLRQVIRGVWWCVDQGQGAAQRWWHARRQGCRP